MQLTPEIKQFIREHWCDDTDKLLLTATRYPGIDVPFAVNQIIARRQIRDKLPEWYLQENIIYPSRLSTEQCSSEQTARYKQTLLRGNSCCDLTGGLGIDTYYFAKKINDITYIERFQEYCTAAAHNFGVLGAKHVRIINADVREILSTLKAATFYIDPARRSGCNKRVFALSDCEPDLLQLKPVLLTHSLRTIVKISPMADIQQTLRLLPETREIHILAVKNECKELLFILEPLQTGIPHPPVKIHAVNLLTSSHNQEFIFQEQEEKNTILRTTGEIARYLYEPNAALLKSGAFRLIASRYDLYKLHQHSHLYTSANLCLHFPGRIFEVISTHKFSGKSLKQLSKDIPQANITTRNFLLSVEEIRTRSHIKEGGDIYLFATTLCNEQKIFIQARKIPV